MLPYVITYNAHMLINQTATRAIWRDGQTVYVIDQLDLPFKYATRALSTVDDASAAIRNMVVRGAPLIGATAAYGMALAMQADSRDAHLQQAYEQLLATRPTAVNLRWALDRQCAELQDLPASERVVAAWQVADAIAEEDVQINKSIGQHGLTVLQALYARLQRPINILTHCNAGWVATVDWGTATSPIYHAHADGMPVHVWVDETRPRNQGAITAWELSEQGVSNTYIVDNAGGLLMQQGQVDMVLVGCDRVAANGDVCNKIGTYLKALAAQAHNIPFYVALPTPTIDWTLTTGAAIPIEERDAAEVLMVREQPVTAGAAVKNYGFDITPAALVTGYITERGVVHSLTELQPV